ncbi:Adaptin N terminal region family protein [Histomonas meleagridis]|uniref:Adaptin N terminal region family protein n=1 Tax=Histomonas meleagridis TaxID=135588 RepID=UPI00355A3DE4|nr:Adaptin N terminal region family protein [Histomonas meleagridis]KAH0803310.1 Adaptin N terminal region family protein [Histomonas meleagridis]
MTQSLSDFISSVRLAETIDQEKFLINTEQAQIRAYLRKMDPDMLPRVVAKIVFLNMLGVNTAWGQMDAIQLMTSDRFSYKRMGYICTSIILDQTNELSVLVTQALLRDLSSTNCNIQNLALSYIANLGSQEICRSVASEVQKLLTSHEPGVVKHAGMATVRIIRLNPDLSDSYKNSVQPLLNSSHHGVVISGINMVIVMLDLDPHLSKVWSQFVGPFTKILKSLYNSRPTREFKYGLHNDPYMQLKCLKALSLLHKKNSELEKLLQTIISSAVPKKNTGRSILYQATETIFAVCKKKPLRALALNQVGRLLSMRDPNILYSALSLFSRVLSSNQASEIDTTALQRYKKQIVKCLDHKDPSIRRRALDVISELIDEKNAETLIPEILEYLGLADYDFRTELVSKIYIATQKYSPSKIWNFDTIHQILIESGNYVSIEIISSFCNLIANSPEIQSYAVSKLSQSLVEHNDQQSLVQVSAFVIGEFATDNSTNIFDLLKRILFLPQTLPDTKMYLITAIAKIAVRFSNNDEAINVMKEMVKSNNIEVQQRAGEMMKLLMQKQYICEEMLAPIADSSASTEQNPIQIIEQNNNENDKEPVDDLLQFVLMDDMSSKQNVKPNNNTTNLLAELDLLDSDPKPSNSKNGNTHEVGCPELYRGNDIIIFGQCKVNPNNRNQIALQMIYFSANNDHFDNFNAEYRIGGGWKINVQKADGVKVSPMGEKALTQVIYLLKEEDTQFMLRVSTTFNYGSQPMSEVCIIKTLPPFE